jgi:hypothetical protein
MLPTPAPGREIPQGLGALGTDWRIDCNDGKTIDCDAWSNLFNRTCWGICSASTLPSGTVPPGQAVQPGGPPQTPDPGQADESITGAVLNAVKPQLSGTALLAMGAAAAFGLMLLTTRK